MTDRVILWTVGLSFLAVLCIGGWREARGQGHAEHHDWYSKLRSNSGFSCCNALTPDGKGDCRPVSARPRDNGNGWEAWYNGQWNRIPESAILPDEFNKVPLYAHICEQSGFIHCFLKGGGGS